MKITIKQSKLDKQPDFTIDASKLKTKHRDKVKNATIRYIRKARTQTHTQLTIGRHILVSIHFLVPYNVTNQPFQDWLIFFEIERVQNQTVSHSQLHHSQHYLVSIYVYLSTLWSQVIVEGRRCVCARERARDREQG